MNNIAIGIDLAEDQDSIGIAVFESNDLEEQEITAVRTAARQLKPLYFSRNGRCSEFIKEFIDGLLELKPCSLFELHRLGELDFKAVITILERYSFLQSSQVTEILYEEFREDE